MPICTISDCATLATPRDTRFAIAAQAIRAGDAECLVAGGMENMSRAPYLMENGRYGYRLGHGQLVDEMIRDGLWDVYNQVHMGICAERTARAQSR